jgi:hypothetical protein
MQILFKVDQKAGIIAGVDCPSSTVKLDVNPVMLTEAQRSMLASKVNAKMEADIEILPPTIDGLVTTLDALEAASVKARQAYEEECWAVLRERRTKIVRSGFIARSPIPAWPSSSWPNIHTLPDDLVASPQYTEWMEQLESQSKEYKAADDESKIKKEDAKTAAEAESKAKLAAVVARIGGTLAEKFALGLAVPDEVKLRVSAQRLSELGLQLTGPTYLGCDTLRGLTDAQFDKFKQWAVPANAQVSFYAYTYDDDPEETYAEAEWLDEESGLRLRADFKLD